MARAKAPVYHEKATRICTESIARLREICEELREDLDHEWSQRLVSAIDDVERACLAMLPITRAGSRIGFGVDKAAKNIAVATAIETLRQIKAAKAW